MCCSETKSPPCDDPVTSSQPEDNKVHSSTPQKDNKNQVYWIAAYFIYSHAKITAIALAYSTSGVNFEVNLSKTSVYVASWYSSVFVKF